jgi:lipopolysaccharide/colanic/teichoic acid biosynthesis glycosyltransferase
MVVRHRAVLLILVLISPLLLAVAIGVKLSSPGPVIFRQRRNGLDGEEIVVYKFRSMRAMDNGPVVAGHQGRPAHHALRRLHAPHLA